MKITYTQYAEFIKEWEEIKETTQLYFGEYFVLKFKISDYELFANHNIEECIDIIMDKYLDLEFSDLGILL